MGEVKAPDDDLQLEEIREGMAQKLSRFREKLNKAKSRIEELQTFYDETKTQIGELTSTDGIKGEYKNDIIIQISFVYFALDYLALRELCSYFHSSLFFSLGELTRSEPDVEDGKNSKDATSDDLGKITKTTTTVQDENVKTTKLATEDSTKDTKRSPTVANDNCVACYVCHVSLPTKQAPHSGKGSFEVLGKTLGGNAIKDEKSFLEILDEPVTESVVSTKNLPKAEDDQSVIVDVTSTLVPDDSVANEVETIPDDQVQQVEKEACTKDVTECTTKVSKEEGDNQSAVVADIPANLVPGDNVVDTRENEAHTTDESTVNVSEAGDSQPVVIPDIRTTFVLDDNVADRIQGEKSTTEVLDASAAEFNISNLVDRIEGKASTRDEPVKNVDGDSKKDDTFNDVQAVFGAEKDDQPATINTSTTLVPGDKVVDQLPSGSNYSEYLITDDVHHSWARVFYTWTLTAGSPSGCEEPRSGYVDIDSVKPAEQVSHVTSTRVANVPGKKGFPQDKDKVEGKANKIS